ncbi:MAG: phage major capsid protein [Lachnospirales bacterium]
MGVNVIDFKGSEALISTEMAKEVFTGVCESSAVLKLARKLPNMTSKQRRLPVSTSLTSAYFVEGESGVNFSNKAWEGVYIDATEIACVVPVPRSVLDDSEFDIWQQVKPDVISAFGKIIDRAILFGENAPSFWPKAIVKRVREANQVVDVEGENSDYDKLLGSDGLVAKVENKGHLVTGHIGKMQSRGYLRSIVDDNNRPIFKNAMTDVTKYDIDGVETLFPKNGALVEGDPMIVSGDFSSLVYAIRQDLTMKLFTEGVIQNPDGSIAYNLLQQDMVALRFVMRLGWQLPNPASNLHTDTVACPFAILE